MRLRLLVLLLSMMMLAHAGPSHVLAGVPSEAELEALNTRIAALYQAGKYSEAIPLAQQSAEGEKTSHGSNSPQYATALNNLALLLQATNRLKEAEPLMRLALGIAEMNFVLHNPSTAAGRKNLATIATYLNNLGQILKAINRLEEAERKMRHALQIDEANFGPIHPNVARDLDNLAQLLLATNRMEEAEPLFRRALAIDEKNSPPDHPDVATGINNLAQLLKLTNRLAEAEPLYRRALAIFEKSFPDHPKAAAAHNNLALLLLATNRVEEAERHMRRALAISEHNFGPDHPEVAACLSNLALLLHHTNRSAEAEPLVRRALAIVEKSSPPNHPSVAAALNNLAGLLDDTNRLEEAEPLMRRALAIWQQSLQPDHPNVALALNNLARMRGEQNDWAGATGYCMRAKAMMIGSKASEEAARGALGKAVLAQNGGNLRGCARAHYHADALSQKNRSEGFELAQWALQNSAADALTAMSARFAKGDAAQSRLVRAEQDLWNARDAAYRRLDAAAGIADSGGVETARVDIAKISGDLAAKQEQLRHDFPGYAALANPKPLPLGQAQQLLGERQALVLFLDMPQWGKMPEETLVFAVTRKEARWASIPLGTAALRERVTALRCGLDSSNWRDPKGWLEHTPEEQERKAQQESRVKTCEAALNLTRNAAYTVVPPFDAAMAYSLYRDLFGGIGDLVKDKSLLVAPSGALTQLPFSVLVTREPDKTLPRFEAYKTAAWLGEQQAITVLPSVGTLKALHTATPTSARAPFIGFGNPLLTGGDPASKRAQLAWAKQDCGKAEPPKPVQTAGLLGSFFSWFGRGGVNLEHLRRQQPLPETADELCAAAGSLGVPKPELGKAVYLGERATVRQIKALSESGELARARVVHFATHGLLAGETKLFAQNHAEPALLLTPPAEADETDNGLLTASEAAQLHLDADWVVMSACNTAAGSSDGAEALSGLARAFFYAGARSLLVSHWYVDSDAAVHITTGAVNTMKAEPGIGRAEALRRSMSALISAGRTNGSRNAHPSIWAPFVLVGNGEP